MHLQNKKSIEPAEYSSLGQIAHFEKPEVSQFGGPKNIDGSPLVVFSGNNIVANYQGTSFSAPRISRFAAKYINDGFEPFEAKAKIIALAEKETPSKKSSSFGIVKRDQNNFATEIRTTFKISNNKPYYLDLKLPDGVEKIIISTANKVKPNINFGEEYSIHDFDASLIWYSPKYKNPEHRKKTKIIKKSNDTNNKYMKEEARRMDGGKYFNSHRKYFDITNIDKAKDEIKKKNPNDEFDLAIRLKKLDLFNTSLPQEAEVSLYIVIYGNFNEEEFESLNHSIIDIESNIEIEI